MRILFKNARILTMIDDKIINGDLVVIDNLIAYIGNDSSSYAPFDRVIDCKQNLLMPGFKNAHTHSAMVFLRGKADDVTLQDWLFKIVFPREARLEPSDIYHLKPAGRFFTTEPPKKPRSLIGEKTHIVRRRWESRLNSVSTDIQ